MKIVLSMNASSFFPYRPAPPALARPCFDGQPDRKPAPQRINKRQALPTTTNRMNNYEKKKCLHAQRDPPITGLRERLAVVSWLTAPAWQPQEKNLRFSTPAAMRNRSGKKTGQNDRHTVGATWTGNHLRPVMTFPLSRAATPRDRRSHGLHTLWRHSSSIGGLRANVCSDHRS